MKKIYTIVATILVANLGIAQDSNDSLTFESITLSTNTFYNGSDGAGQIQIGDFNLTNFFDVPFQYFVGFAVSNVMDITTAGYANQYASFAGGGSNSENYGVFYSAGVITFPSDHFISQLEVTNTTFAGLSMRDGDAFSKQFGSLNNAGGTPDGTNGEDFFLLKIIPLNGADEAMGDTIDFYLADYRFTDNTQDYILNTWENALPAQGIVARKLKFELTSTDNGGFGMNTPNYFALDNLVATSTVRVEENQLNWSILPNPTAGLIQIKTENKGKISILNSIGAIVFESSMENKLSLDLSYLPSGIYFANFQTAKGTSIQKIIKQ